MDNRYGQLRLLCFVLVTACAVSSHAQPTITYVENFQNNANRWWTGRNTTAAAAMRNGTYSVERFAEKGFWGLWTKYLIPILPGEDFRIDMTVRFLNGCNAGYGFFWGGIGIERFHYYNLSNTENYIHESFKDNQFHSVIPWTPHKAIKPAPATNRMSVRRQGQRLELSVNGVKVNTVPAKPFFGPQFGLLINGNMHVEVDDFVITRWTQSVPHGLNVICNGAFGSRAVWPNNTDWSPFDFQLVPGGSLTVNTTGPGNQVFANATVQRPETTPVGASVGTYIGTADGALVKLEWLHAATGRVVRLSAFAGEKPAGTKEVPWEGPNARLILRRRKTTFRAEVGLAQGHRTVRRTEVGSLDWPGIGECRNAGIAATYGPAKNGPAKLVFKCLRLYLGGGKG